MIEGVNVDGTASIYCFICLPSSEELTIVEENSSKIKKSQYGQPFSYVCLIEARARDGGSSLYYKSKKLLCVSSQHKSVQVAIRKFESSWFWQVTDDKDVCNCSPNSAKHNFFFYSLQGHIKNHIIHYQALSIMPPSPLYKTLLNLIHT